MWGFPQIGVPPVIIHILVGIPLSLTIQLWGCPIYGPPVGSQALPFTVLALVARQPPWEIAMGNP